MGEGAKTIAVGSIKHGQGMTAITFNLAYKLSSLINKKILIIDTNFLFKELGYIAEQSNPNGIDDLISMVKTQEITKEIFMLHTEEINKNLRIINSTKIDSLDYVKKNNEHMMKIIDVAKEYFDIIVIDAAAGIKNSLNKAIYKKCDVFINVLTQNPYIIDWYVKHDEYKGEKTLNVINMYEEDVYPNINEIKKDSNLDNLILIRYSKLFRDFYNQRILDPLYKTEDLFNNDFAQLITKIGQVLEISELNKLDIVNTNMLIEVRAAEKKKGFLSLFNMFNKK